MLNIVSYDKPVFYEDKLNVWAHQLQKSHSLIMSMLQHRAGHSKKLDARKLKLKDVSAKDAKVFLTENHLAGSTNSSYRYGLFQDDTLMMLVTLGKPRFAKNFDLEVLRLATKAGFIVRGGAGKLFKYIKQHHTGALLSYSDRLLGAGKVYERAGFTHIGRTKPGYFWEKNGVVLHRFQTQKHKLLDLLGDIDLSKSELVLMQEAGWRRVHDFGNDRWVLELGERPDNPINLKFHYTYKITRPTIDNSYYIGVHSTNNLDDGYLGSGNLITASIKKYGKHSHHKQILEHYETRLEACAAEAELITLDELKDPACLNIALGGGSPIIPVGFNNGLQWIHYPPTGKEVFISKKDEHMYYSAGWVPGRCPGKSLNGLTGRWYSINGVQYRGEVPANGVLGRLNGTTKNKTWVIRGGKRLLVDKPEPSDELVFNAKTNKGKKMVLIDGKRKLVDPELVALENNQAFSISPTTGKIGMRSPSGEKRLVLPDIARELVKQGWCIATKQLRSAPPQVLELAAELGLTLPRKKMSK